MDDTITLNTDVFGKLFHAIAKVFPLGAIVSMTKSRRFRVAACAQRREVLKIWIVANNKRKFITIPHKDLDDTTLAKIRRPRGKLYVKFPEEFSLILELIRARCPEKAVSVIRKEHVTDKEVDHCIQTLWRNCNEGDNCLVFEKDDWFNPVLSDVLSDADII